MTPLEKSGYGIPRKAHTVGKYYGYTLALALIACALLASWGDTISGINPS